VTLPVDEAPSTLNPFRAERPRDRVLRSAAIFVTLGLHAAAAFALAMNPGLARKAATWVEVTVQQVAAPPPPEPPPPAPEPPKKKAAPRRRAPEKVAIEQTAPEEAPTPQPDAAPDPKPVRRVQGLSATSFAPGAGTGLSVRAGNTTAVAASGKGLSLTDANGFLVRPASAVATQPRLVWEPPALDVPEAARDARAQGTIEVELDVDGEGRVARAVLVRDIGFGTGEACVAAWRTSRWKPGLHDGQPLTVTGIRKLCTVRGVG
jgi:protein TonB